MLIPPAVAFLFKNKDHFQKQGGCALDFGDQLLFDANHAASLFSGFEDLALNKTTYEQVSVIYNLLGMKSRKCLDYNQNADFRVNLNYSLIGFPELESEFDFVTNQGFSEHVFNQYAVFEAIHYVCKPGGLMLHVLPCQGWADGQGWGHGFYQYQPNLFRHLILSNGYEIIDLQLSPNSLNPYIFEFNSREYSPFVNFHLQKQEYRKRRNLGSDGIFASFLALLRMPQRKTSFQLPHEKLDEDH